jgi:hypothetical protein
MSKMRMTDSKATIAARINAKREKETGLKTCRACKIEKELKDYAPRTKYNNKLQATCRKCQMLKNKMNSIKRMKEVD